MTHRREFTVLLAIASSLPTSALALQTPTADAPRTATASSTPAPRENYLGVFTEPVTRTLATQLADQLPDGKGVVVTRVLPRSPAAEAGVKADDILVAFDDLTVASPEQLKQLIVDAERGREVRLTVVRAAARRTVAAKLAERDRLPQSARAAIEVRVPPTATYLKPDPDGEEPREPQTVDVPGARIRIRVRNGVEAAEAATQPASRSVSVGTKDGRTYSVHVVDARSDGEEPRRYDLEGEADTIRAALDDLPEPVRADVDELVGRLQSRSETDRNPAFRLQLRARIRNGRGSLQVILTRAGKEGSLESFALEHGVDNDDDRQAVDRLLANDEFSEELGRLSPTVRKRVEQTLRRVPLPRVRMDVQRSQ